MNIIIVGCGKTGFTIARRLSKTHNIVIIDKRPLEELTESLDVLTLQGDGISRKTLEEAGAAKADMLISVVPGDEANVLSCLTAKQLGAQYTAARIRNPEYALELFSMRKEFGVDLIINPDQLSALAISRLLRYPSANDIEIFAHGYIELVSFHISADDCLNGLTIARVVEKFKVSVIFAVVTRKGQATIPRGDFLLHTDDTVSILGRPGQITDFFKQTKRSLPKIKDVMMIGGGTIAYYLARLLTRHGIDTKILEKSAQRCNVLSRNLPDTLIINGDGTDRDLLHEENIEKMDGVVCLTDRDEENIVVGLYCRQLEIPRAVVKVNHISQVMTANLNLGSVVSPKFLVAEQVIDYITGLENAMGKKSKTMYKVHGSGIAEVLEFNASPEDKCINTPLKDLRLRRAIIIGCILRKNKIITPVGTTEIHPGDVVILVNAEPGVSDIDDILLPEEVR